MNQKRHDAIRAQDPSVPHWHVCQQCADVWRHQIAGPVPPAEYLEEHRCPSCGCGPYYEAFDTELEGLAEAGIWR